MTDILYPADRTPPVKEKINKETAITKARQKIRDAVPNGGSPKTFSDLIKIVRSEADCYLLFPEDIKAIIEEEKPARPEKSQQEYDTVVEAGNLTPKETEVTAEESKETTKKTKSLGDE